MSWYRFIPVLSKRTLRGPIRSILIFGGHKINGPSACFALLHAILALCLIATFGCLAGCSCTTGNIALGTAGVTLAGARSVGQELEQTYYLGVFDPHEQLPPMVYRVRVRGQASILSEMKFGSGWVPARLIDSLGTGVKIGQGKTYASIEKESDPLSTFRAGRRLVLFGPEGFREAPKDHRLVIVMGSDPEGWFNAMDQSLGAVSQVISRQHSEALTRLLLASLSESRSERLLLDRLAADVEKELADDGQ